MIHHTWLWRRLNDSIKPHGECFKVGVTMKAHITSSSSTVIYLQAASGQYQGVRADHQHRKGQHDQEDPLSEKWHKHEFKHYDRNMVSFCIGKLNLTHPLSRISRTAWLARRTWGSGEALCQEKKTNFTHIIYIMHHKGTGTFAALKVLAFIWPSGHTWGKECMRQYGTACGVVNYSWGALYLS